ncbi:MAG: hypothetical protein MUF54_11145 [Polyangiaceae bacterium]|nr:hypothetical protein [Polyangiaceae bacterium]
MTHFLPALTPTDIHWVCAMVATRVCSLLRRRELLRDRADDNDGAVRLAPSTALDACRQAALSRGRFELLDPKGRAQQQLCADEPTFCRSKKCPWAADVDGSSVEAGVHLKLLRCLLRAPIATQRFSRLRDGCAACLFYVCGRGSKTDRIMRPMEAMARIAAVVPPPRRPTMM